MGDFLFIRNKKATSQFAQSLKDLMPEPELINVQQYSGSWGDLAVSLGPYNGFEPYEEENYICVVIGGPVLYWRDNHFLTDPEQPTAATYAIFQRWKSCIADWSEDLSGPFVIFIVDKKTEELFCYTDLMMFIPVYQHTSDMGFCLGTHVDTVAKASEQDANIDETSVADFILHGIVTYPYTIYSDLFQLAPATEHKWISKSGNNIEQRNSYWEPLEVNQYKNINEAATALRTSLSGYIERVTEKMTEVGQFISAGEDSRSIAGMLPERLNRHAYIYVDSKNREFKLAKRVADVYGCVFHYVLRSPTHYLDILPNASKLVGSGQQYTHAHTLGLAKQSGADKHLAVFGGYAADSLLKAMHIRKFKHWNKISFLPDIELKGEVRTKSILSKAFNKSILIRIDKRRKEHMKYIKSLQPTKHHEWFMLWPYTMREAMPNLSVNRRLFCSYELFTSKDAVKIAASIPVKWKLNRSFFNKVIKKSLSKSRWIPHHDGRLPYFGWQVNTLIQLPRWLGKVYFSVFNSKPHDGSWGDWNAITKSDLYKYYIYSYPTSNLNFIQVMNYNQIRFIHGNKYVF